MKEAYRILPVCAGDVSGIASALYELGGMVVIHDPSGCNSTYNTHDEIRWYDQESRRYRGGGGGAGPKALFYCDLQLSGSLSERD